MKQVRRLLTGVSAALGAVALVAAFVSVAQAEAPEFHVEETPATLTGSHVSGTELYFATGAGKVKCTGSSSTGTQSTTSSTTMRLATSYSGCSILGLSVTVKMNECEEVVALEGGSSPPTGTVEMSCPTGGEPELTVQDGCVFKWEPPKKPAQPKVVEENTSGPPKDIDLKFIVSGLPYVTKGCAVLGIKDGTYENGERVNTQTIKADNKGGTQIAIYVE